MHIALVHMRHADSGGTERYLHQISASLASLGHQVTIVCRTHVAPSHPDIRFVELHAFAIGNAWRMWAFASDVERHVRSARYDIVFGLGRTWSQDVLRLGGGSYATYLELAHEQTLEPWERVAHKGWLKTRLALEIEKRALGPGAFRHVITNSEMVRRDVIERHGVREDQITVVYNGVDLERFHPRQREGAGRELRRELGWDADEHVVLFLGTGYGRKGLAELLPAFAVLAAEKPESRLLVVGFDSSQQAYEKRARSLGLREYVRFLGGRSDTEACYGAADVYALPTLYDPFASTTLEALATGLPVITTSTNGAAEILRHGLSGSILPRRREIDALERELLFWSDRERLKIAAPIARETAEQHGAERTMSESARILAQVATQRFKRERATPS